MDSVPAVIFIRRAEAGFPVDFASVNVKSLGYEVSYFKDGKTLYADIVHPEDLEAFNFAVISNSERGIKDYTLEYRILTKNGELRWVEDRTLIRYGKNGRISHYIGIVSDITERRKLKEKVEQEKKKFNSLLNSSSDAIIILEKDGKFLEVNGEACRRLGYNEEELLALNPAKIDTKFEIQFPRLVKKIHLAGKAVFESTHFKKDGTPIPVEVEAQLMDYEGRDTVLTVSREISEQKKMKKDLSYTLKVNKVLEFVVNSSPVVVYLSSPRETRPIEFITDNIIRFGYSAGEFTSGKLLYEDIVHPLDLEKVRESFFRNYTEGRMDYSQEYRILTASGEVKWVDEKIFIHLDEKGEIEYLHGVLIDITERRQSKDFLRLQRDFASAIASVDEIQDIMRQLLGMALEIETLDSGCIYLLEEEEDKLRLKTCKGLSPAFVNSAADFGKTSGFLNLLRIGKPIYRQFFEIKDIVSLKAPKEEKIRATALIPIFCRGRFAAAMQISSHTADSIPELARKQLETIALELGNQISRIKEKAELQQTNSDFQSLFKSIKDFILIVNLEGCIVHSNPALRKRLSYTEKELFGKNILSLHPQNRVLEAAKNFSDMLEGKTSVYNVPFITKEGEDIFAETRFSRGSWRGQEVLIALSRPRSSE